MGANNLVNTTSFFRLAVLNFPGWSIGISLTRDVERKHFDTPRPPNPRWLSLAWKRLREHFWAKMKPVSDITLPKKIQSAHDVCNLPWSWACQVHWNGSHRIIYKLNQFEWTWPVQAAAAFPASPLWSVRVLVSCRLLLPSVDVFKHSSLASWHTVSKPAA